MCLIFVGPHGIGLRNAGADNRLMAKAFAYFDESGTDKKSEVLCVAGYIFLEEMVVLFEAEWKAKKWPRKFEQFFRWKLWA